MSITQSMSDPKCEELGSADFIKWLLRQGHEVIRTESGTWYKQSHRIYQSFPYHRCVSPDRTELVKLFREHKALAVRYSTNLEKPQGFLSYHVIWDSPDVSLSVFKKKVRYDIKKGLNTFSFSKISFQELAEDGWLNREDTLTRQQRDDAEDKNFWLQLCNSAIGLDGFEAWGAITETGELAASMLCYIDGDTASILYQQSSTAFLSLGVNNALTYSFMKYAMDKRKVARIFYGLNSLDAPVSVDQYKFRMGFYPLIVRQCIEVNPIIRPFFNQTTYKILTKLNNSIENNSISKAKGLLNFYLQGKLPIEQQSNYEDLKSYLVEQ